MDDPPSNPTAPGSGPQSFGDRLAALMRDRSMTLQELSDRLLDQGYPCSVSTLSLWRRGLTVPTREHALRAVAALEGILGTEPGYLVSAGQPPEPGTPGWWNAPIDPRVVRTSEEIVAEIRASLQTDDRRGMNWLTIHESAYIGRDRSVERLVSSEVIRAARDGARRLQVATYTDRWDENGDPVLLMIEATSGGTVTGVKTFPETTHVVTEITFDAPLSKGELLLLEYESRYTAPAPFIPGNPYFQEIYTARPVGQVLIEAHFPHGDVPDRIWSVLDDQPDAEPESLPRTPVTPIGDSASAAVTALQGGGLRLGWSWSSPLPD